MYGSKDNCKSGNVHIKPTGDCFAEFIPSKVEGLAMTLCFLILLSTVNRQLSTLFLGAPRRKKSDKVTKLQRDKAILSS